ncbi:hypothetical protein I3842_Q011500 [Carya illinoinensis]|uniref:Uncharacterized protein n=1 Tax=Carya illinoinensis TaxID=32201 RepID=A0A921ZZ43_CARIL|nr:hypothetical protein I3842_Q011500 [Carya illinoinensis]
MTVGGGKVETVVLEAVPGEVRGKGVELCEAISVRESYLERSERSEGGGRARTIRRGQDSNLQSSGHGPDESTNSSTPLLPLLFLSLFPPRSPALVAWPG